MKRSRKTIVSAAVMGALVAAGSSASAQDTVVIYRKAKDADGNVIQNSTAYAPERIPESDLGVALLNGAEVLIADDATRADGTQRRTTSFLGAIFAPYADVSVRFQGSRRIEDDRIITGVSTSPREVGYPSSSRAHSKNLSFDVSWFPEVVSGHSNNGHGNNADGVDVSNPGQGHGGPNGAVDESGDVDDEIHGGSGSAALDFGDYTLAAFPAQDKNGTAESRQGGKALKLSGNLWKAIPFNYTVTENTVLEVEFSSTKKAEFQSIGFWNNLNDWKGFRDSNMITLAGPESFGDIRDYLLTEGTGVSEKLTIEVGKHYTGAFQYLCFINDHDNGSKDGSCEFKNVRVYERGRDTVNWDAVDDYLYGTVQNFIIDKASEHRAAKLNGERADETSAIYPVLEFGANGAARVFVFQGAYRSEDPSPCAQDVVGAYQGSWNPESDVITRDIRNEIVRRFQEMVEAYGDFDNPNVNANLESESFAFEVPSTDGEANGDDADGDGVADSTPASDYHIEFSRNTVGQRDPTFYIRIGDVDGFGFGAAEGCYAANGGPANPDGDAVLGTGDFMPDLNRDRVMATGSKDDFDHRDAAEYNGNAYYAHNCTFSAANMRGVEFTDIALSTSYDGSRNKNEVHVKGLGATWPTGSWRKNSSTYYNNPEWFFLGRNSSPEFGQGGDFPKPPSNSRPNQPGFVFDFESAEGAIVEGQSIFFNMVTADYDVTPFRLILTNIDGQTIEVPVVHQSNSGGEDGLVQAAFARMPFDFVFKRIDGGGYRGFLRVDMDAPNEPYLCYDFVELSTRAIDVEGDGNHLDIFGHVVYSADSDFDPAADGHFDVSRHEGQLKSSRAPRFVPEPVIVTDDAPLPTQFGEGEHEITESQTLDNFVLANGAVVRVTGNVTLNVFGDINIPLGARLVITDGSSVKIYNDGAITIRGVIDNALPKQLRIISTLDSDATNRGISVDLEGGRFLGSLVGKRLSINAVDNGQIKFTYDKAMATQGISEAKTKLRVRALLDDKE